MRIGKVDDSMLRSSSDGFWHHIGPPTPGKQETINTVKKNILRAFKDN